MAAKYFVLLVALFTINTCNGKFIVTKDILPTVPTLSDARISDILQGNDMQLLRNPEFLRIQAATLPDEVKKSLDEVMALISKSITDAFAAISAGYKQFSADVTYIINTAASTVRTQTSSSLTKITLLQNILKSISKPTTCIAGKADQINAVGAPLTKALRDCADDQIIDSSSTIGAQMDQVTNYTDVGTGLEQEFKDCGDGIGAVPCLMGLKLKLSDKRRTLGAEIKAIADGAMGLVAAATQQVKFCGFISDANATYNCANIVQTALNECNMN